MCHLQRIKTFLASHPDQEFGPASEVLAEKMIDNESIDSAIGNIDLMLGGNPPASMSERYDGMNLAEMKVTKDFLSKLRRMQFKDRMLPGDWLCDDVAAGVMASGEAEG